MLPLEDDVLARTIGETLIARGAKIAVMESTAGGLVSARLLSVPGASAWFDRGYVAYSGPAKADAGTDLAQLRATGAVAAEAVLVMARGARDKAAVAYAVAESGIAGPQGSRRSTKPVGFVAIAAVGPEGERAVELQLDGSRAEVMVKIAEATLQLLAELMDAASAG
ncbi:MAG: CinA family protein [Dehalococcoidia bacterium]|nr:CinA family protein [Dehalococcoidia bacterium]